MYYVLFIKFILEHFYFIEKKYLFLHLSRGRKECESVDLHSETVGHWVFDSGTCSSDKRGRSGVGGSGWWVRRWETHKGCTKTLVAPYSIEQTFHFVDKYVFTNSFLKAKERFYLQNWTLKKEITEAKKWLSCK